MKIGTYIFGGLLLALLLSVGATSSCFAQATGFFDYDFKEPAQWDIVNGKGNFNLDLTGEGYLYYKVTSPSQPWQDTEVSPGGAYIQYPSLRLKREFSGNQWVFETKVLYAMPNISPDRVNIRQFVTWVCFGDRNNSIRFAREAKQAGTGAHYDRMRCTVTLNGVSQHIELNPSYPVYYFKVIRGVKNGNTVDDKKLQIFWSDHGDTWYQIGTDITLSSQTAALSQYVMLNGGALNSIDPLISADIMNSYAMYDYIKVSSVKIVAIDENGDIIEPDIEKLLLGQRQKFRAVSVVTEDPITVDWTADHKIDPPLPSTPNSPFPLFQNMTGIFFDPNSTSSTKEFQAIHLGEVKLIVSHPTTSTQLATKKISVIRPTRLGHAKQSGWIGAGYNQYDTHDDLIITLSNETGIPPQYIKGQIFQETRPKFDPDSYRYEPGYDFEYMQSQKNDSLFRSYKLADNASESDGAGVSRTGSGNNIYPRGRYYVIPNQDWTFPPASGDPRLQPNPQPPAPPIDAQIADAATYVTCANIFYRNDKLHTRQNWTKKIKEEEERNPPDPTNWAIQDFKIRNLHDHWVNDQTDFVAQTIISASYGLFQFMYDTLVGEAGSTNPKDLLTPSENFKIAKAAYARRWPRSHPAAPSTHYPNNYNEESQWVHEWKNFLQKWNNANDTTLAYGTLVIDNADKIPGFLPE